MNLIDRITQLMIEKNISKADLYRLTGLKKSTLYNIFDKKTNTDKVKLDTIKAIAKALDTTVDYLMFGNVRNESEKQIPQILINYELLTNEGKKKADEYISDLLKIYAKDNGEN